MLTELWSSVIFISIFMETLHCFTEGTVLCKQCGTFFFKEFKRKIGCESDPLIMVNVLSYPNLNWRHTYRQTVSDKIWTNEETETNNFHNIQNMPTLTNQSGDTNGVKTILKVVQKPKKNIIYCWYSLTWCWSPQFYENGC